MSIYVTPPSFGCPLPIHMCLWTLRYASEREDVLRHTRQEGLTFTSFCFNRMASAEPTSFWFALIPELISSRQLKQQKIVLEPWKSKLENSSRTLGKPHKGGRISAQHWISLNFSVLKLFCYDPHVYSLTLFFICKSFALFLSSPTASAASRNLPEQLREDVGERFFLHGTSPETVLAILHEGFSEKLASLRGVSTFSQENHSHMKLRTANN